jgi:hypothetical protein
LNLRPGNHQCLGTRPAHSDHRNPCARAVEGFRQVEKDLTTPDPKQVMSRAFGAASDTADGEDIDMSESHLQHVLTVVEKLRVTAIERDAGWRANRRVVIGYCWRRLEDGFGHS